MHSRFAAQPLDESAQIPLAAVMLLRLNSKIGELTARIRSLVSKSRDLQLLLTGVSTKASELPVGCGPVFGHRPRIRDAHRPRERTAPAMDGEQASRVRRFCLAAWTTRR